MSAGFALAPWTYEVHELSNGISAIVYDDHGFAIADHLREDFARLIASAPKLCNDLTDLCQQLEDAHAEAFDACDGTCSYHAALKRARATIAEARGEAL